MQNRIDIDWKAALSSEVFREYASTELIKEAEKEANKAEELKQEAEQMDLALTAFDNFEEHIKKSPKLRNQFIKIKEALLTNPELVKKTNTNFVNAVMMLELD